MRGQFDSSDTDHFSDPPSAPQKLKVTDVTAQSVKLTWKAPKDNGGADVTGYDVSKQRVNVDAAFTSVCDVDASCTECVVGELCDGAEYKFAVSARNAAGSSPQPKVSDVVTRKPKIGELQLVRTFTSELL